MISAIVVSHPGMKRSENQDALLVPGFCSTGLTGTPVIFRNALPDTAPAALYAVIDGMGGQVGGQRASRDVAFYLADAINRAAMTATRWDVGRLLDGANRMLYERMEREPALTGLGATIAGAAITGHDVTIFNIGDARAYQHADGYLMLLSTDDRSSPSSHEVTQSLGGACLWTGISPHIVALEPLRVGDRLLIASDGLTEVVSFNEISEALSDPDPVRAATALLEQTLAGGAPDNVTFMLIEELED